ncbi:hypothetical protein Poli38472_012380 [Pythium oligandrum]|uniref:Uncharacterized protein n=1 Tax=Pythium oligandrum TaxID=41045 RepID=A0A8K1CQ99_PYTOL|nr:hypothetical protein Poli38472_012380 [Pythium oligandrum]|eukprot:TMW67264.1 hypothetical protein Poli38472_012380 [Pythium oligandrum]
MRPLMVRVRLRPTQATTRPAAVANARAPMSSATEEESCESSGEPPKRRARRASSRQSSEEPRARYARRKPSYLVKKEEKHVLLQEIYSLENHVAQLRHQLGAPTLMDEQLLDEGYQQRRKMKETLQTQQLRLVGLQSLLARHINGQLVNPLHSFIHLGRDKQSRRDALLALRREKLQFCHQFIEERLRYIDCTQPYESTEHFVSECGDVHFVGAQVALFEGAHSVQQVYEALSFGLSNLEIALTEVIGHLTIREDIDEVETRISNHRLVSSIEAGIIQELNLVHYTEYYPHFEGVESDGYALVAADCVDLDELYPYFPQERVQKDISAAMSLSSFRRPRPNAGPEDPGELVVVYKRCAYMAIRRPQFEISHGALEELSVSLVKWGEVMLEQLRHAITCGGIPVM